MVVCEKTKNELILARKRRSVLVKDDGRCTANALYSLPVYDTVCVAKNTRESKFELVNKRVRSCSSCRSGGEQSPVAMDRSGDRWTSNHTQRSK